MTLITLIIESFLSSEQITLTLSVQRPYLLTYSYDIALLYSLGCIRPKPTCRTLITLIKESFLSSEQITLTLSVQRPYLLTYSYDIVLLYSLGCIHPKPTCQTLITLITLVTESFLTIWTDTVQLPVNGPCKSRYLAINVICTTVLSLNIQLYHCIAVFPRLHPNTTYIPNTDDTDYTDNRVVFIVWTDNVNAICTTTISADIQLWFVLLYSLGCIRPIPTCRTLITLITLIIESLLSSEQITLTLSVQRPYLLIYGYDIVLLYSLGCIHPIPTWQTLITLITLVPESFLTISTDTVQLPVNGPCKSRYLAINVICTTVLSLNIQLYHCIAVFPRLHLNTTYMPNTDDTDYTDNRVVFIIWTDNVNAICTTTISADIQLWYCIAVFPRLYPFNTNMPNTDYTDYTDNRVVFIIWTDNVNAICTTTISSYIQLWYCIAVFPGLYPSNTYLPDTDYTDYTDNIVVFIIWTDNVNAICTTTISSNIQLWYCIAVFPRLYPPNTYLPNTDYTDYTGCRVVFNHLHR